MTDFHNILYEHAIGRCVKCLIFNLTTIGNNNMVDTWTHEVEVVLNSKYWNDVW